MPPKRILLMFISEVSGHRSAAEAVEKAIRQLEPEAEIFSINAFNYTNPATEKIINRIYMNVIQRAPAIWSYLYDNPKVMKRLERFKNIIHKFNSPKLKKLFDEFKPDVIACTQAFPCGMVADYKKNYNYNMPLVAILTDFVPHSYWIYDKINYYISPSEFVTERLVKKGVPVEKIKTFGIPFDPKFNVPLDRIKIAECLKLDYKVPTILIMGGGHGLGPIKTIIESLEKVHAPMQEIVVCGTNKKLYESLTKTINKYNKKILLYGYVNNINELMAVSDIIISKPGGVTTAEVLTKRLAMVIVQPIPGQEANNTDYLTEKGAAIEVNKPQDIHLVIEDLLNHQEKLNRLHESAALISKPNSSIDIAKLLLSL